MRSILMACLLLVATSAPAGWKAVEPGTTASPPNGGFTVQPPAGWNYDTARNIVLAARNGVYLDALRITLTPHKSAFKAIKKTSASDSLPEDLAELYVACLQAEGVLRDVTLLSTEPAELAGRPAFRMRLQYRIPDGLGGTQMDELTVGAAIESGLLVANFYAPRIHFFEQSLPAAEEAIRSVALVPAK